MLTRKMGLPVPRTETFVGPTHGSTEDTYSVCMLCSNDGETVKASVYSVLELSKYRKLDVVIVDNLSADGSQVFLRRVRDEGLIRLIERRCNRGEGRQFAFNSSKGDYVLSHMDCDDIFDASAIDSLISQYHAFFEGKAIMTKKRDSSEASNITIAPRTVIEQVGGWRPLNWGEDWDLWARLAGAGLYAFVPYPVENPPHKNIKVRAERYTGPTRGFGVRVSKYTDGLRIGRKVFDSGEHISAAQRAAFTVARIRVTLGGGSLAPVPNPEFNEVSST